MIVLHKAKNIDSALSLLLNRSSSLLLQDDIIINFVPHQGLNFVAHYVFVFATSKTRPAFPTSSKQQRIWQRGPATHLCASIVSSQVKRQLEQRTRHTLGIDLVAGKSVNLFFKRNNYTQWRNNQWREGRKYAMTSQQSIPRKLSICLVIINRNIHWSEAALRT